MSIRVTLDSHFETFVSDLVNSGRYSTAGEVLQDGLRLLEESEKRREHYLVAVRDRLEEGRASGLSDEDGEAFLDRLEATYRKALKPSAD